MSASYLRKYGTGTGADIYINIPKAGSANHAVSADWTPAAGDVKISKDGGAAANIGTLPTAIAMGNSTIWKFVFADAELQAAMISVTISDSATKAVDDTGFSIETYGNASALHAFDLDTATQGVNLTQIGGDAQSATDLKDFADAGYDPATNKVQGVVLTDTVTTLTNLPAITANWLTAAGTAADFGTEIGAAVLTALGTGTWATAIPWNASWDAEVQSEVQDAIEVNKLDHLVAVADADDVVDNSIIAKMSSKGATADWSTFVNTTDSLEALRDRGDAAWITATGFSTLDAAGVRTAVGLASANLDTQLADLPTVAEFEARTLVAANYFDPAADTVANVTTVGSVSGAVGSVTGNVGGSVVGSVASVTGNVGGNVAGSVASVTAAVAITSNVKKNQALAEFQFLMTDSTNHSPATGKTVTCTRSIDGAAFAAGTLANVTEVANGTYTVDFGAGDLNGNVIVLRATATGCDDTFERILTQP